MPANPQDVFTQWLTTVCFASAGTFTTAFLLAAAAAILLVIGSGLEERRLA
jgi:hypothetical protein